MKWRQQLGFACALMAITVQGLAASAVHLPCLHSSGSPFDPILSKPSVESLKPVIELAGNGSRGPGGGGAAACFPPKVDSSKAVLNGKLLPSYYDRMSSLNVLEFEEDSKLGLPSPILEHTMLLPSERESPKEFLYRVLDDNWKATAPELVTVIKDAIEYVDPLRTRPAPWPDEDLARIDDLGNLLSNEDNWLASHNCVRVQLARRDTGGPDGYRLAYNKRLYERLGIRGNPQFRVMNQAMLILHEAIYLIAAKLGQENSTPTRRLVSVLLSADPADRLRDPEKLTHLLRRIGLDEYFKLIPFSNREEESRKLPRQKAYDDLVQGITQAKNRMVGKNRVLQGDGTPVPPSFFFEDPETSQRNSPMFAAKGLSYVDFYQRIATEVLSKASAEEVFLYAAERLSSWGDIHDFEALLSPSANDAAQAAKVCSYIDRTLQYEKGQRSQLPERFEFADMLLPQEGVERASLYCHRLGY